MRIRTGSKMVESALAYQQAMDAVRTNGGTWKGWEGQAVGKDGSTTRRWWLSRRAGRHYSIPLYRCKNAIDCADWLAPHEPRNLDEQRYGSAAWFGRCKTLLGCERRGTAHDPRGEDPIDGALPLRGKAYWIARASEPGIDLVGPDFSLAPPPRAAGRARPGDALAAATAPRPKSRARRAA